MSDVIEAASVRVSTLADGTLRLVLDVEPRNAQDAFRLFASPGTAVALAALKSAESLSKADKPAKPVQSERMGPLCEWAVMRCKEPKFWEWIRPVYGRLMGGNGTNWGDVTPHDFGGSTERYARHALLVLCDVDSRKKLDADALAGAEFKRLVMHPYAAWLQKQGVTA